MSELLALAISVGISGSIIHASSSRSRARGGGQKRQLEADEGDAPTLRPSKRPGSSGAWRTVTEWKNRAESGSGAPVTVFGSDTGVWRPLGTPVARRGDSTPTVRDELQLVQQLDRNLQDLKRDPADRKLPSREGNDRKLARRHTNRTAIALNNMKWPEEGSPNVPKPSFVPTTQERVSNLARTPKSYTPDDETSYRGYTSLVDRTLHDMSNEHPHLHPPAVRANLPLRTDDARGDTRSTGYGAERLQRPWYITKDQWDAAMFVKRYREDQAEKQRIEREYEDTMNFIESNRPRFEQSDDNYS